MKKDEENNKGASDATNDLLNGIFGEKPLVNQTDAEKEGLKGKVKQIRQKHYKAFERDGNVYLGVMEGESYENKNKTRTYNEGGKELENISFSPDGTFHTTIFNEKGKETEITYYNSAGVVSTRNTRTYNADDDLIEMIEYDGEGEVTAKSLMTYLAKGKYLTSDTLDKDDVIIRHNISIYDKNGWRVETRSIDTKGELIYWCKYKNNSKGNMVESTTLKPEDESVLHHTTMYECYDAAGDHLKRDPFVKEADKYTSRVEKDGHGNWTKKMLCYRNQAAFIYMREIEYFDEVFVPEETFSSDYFKLPLLIKNVSIEPMTALDIMNVTKDSDGVESATVLNPADAKWLMDKSRDHENFSFLAYYTIKNNDFPSVITYSAGNIEVRALLKELELDLDARIVNSVKTVDSNGSSMLDKFTLIFPEHPGYMIHVSGISEVDADSYEDPPFLDDVEDGNDGTLHLSDIIILIPSDASGLNEYNTVMMSIEWCMEQCMVEILEDKPKISMVQVTGNGAFTLQSHAAKDDFEIDDLDIQYGYGFEKFHDDLMDRFRNENQGLVLFHGIPGTGKTYYIRHLLREMAIAKKIVIYMPPNMVDYLVEPAFMTFLSHTVTTFSAQGKFCVLLIEDAEPLLASRNTNGRIQGVTNLLNMTDGLLNDMLKLQIICTFNVDLKELDAALLRPGRLIARKEFKALPELDANLLAQSLGIKHNFTAPATLSEIYARLKNKSTLIHDEY